MPVGPAMKNQLASGRIRPHPHARRAGCVLFSGLSAENKTTQDLCALCASSEAGERILVICDSSSSLKCPGQSLVQGPSRHVFKGSWVLLAMVRKISDTRIPWDRRWSTARTRRRTSHVDHPGHVVEKRVRGHLDGALSLAHFRYCDAGCSKVCPSNTQLLQ